MIDAQRLIEEIKHLLYSVGNPLPDEVVSLAGDYLELCNEANERLRACSQLLKRGLRSEAIQQAEHEPNLVDLVAALDFAERSQWCEYLRRSGELLPPELLLDTAAELNEAYAVEQPLAVLLQKNRKLALARAPLARRIRTLRELAKADPMNSVWQDDVATFEVARHGQIEAELGAAVQSGNVQALAELESEVFTPGWRQLPPDPLRAKIQKAHARARQQSARLELGRLEPQLSEAHAVFDVERARKLRAQWQSCASLADLSASDPLFELAAPALAWLADEDRREAVQAEFESDVSELQRKLDNGRDREELERLYFKVTRHDLELPPNLELRFRERLAAIESTARRRLVLIIVGAVCGLLVLAAVTTVAVRHKIFTNAVAEASEHLKSLLDKQKLDEAHDYLDSLEKSRPDIAQAGDVREQAVRYEALQKAEDDRRARFDLTLKKVETTANFDAATFKSLAAAKEQLKKEASPLAHRPDEKTQVVKLDGRIDAAQIVAQKRIDDEIASRLQKFSERSEELDRRQFEPAASQADALTELRNRLTELGEQYVGRITPQFDENRRGLVMHVESQQKLEADRKLRQQWQDIITQAVGDRPKFLAMLNEYSKRFPESPRARPFQQVVTEQSLWEAISRWDDAVKHLDPKTPATFLVEGPKIKEDPILSRFPEAADIGRHVIVFESIKKQEDALKQFREFLDNPLYNSLYAIDVRRDGAIIRYYVLKEPSGAPLTFRYIKNFELDDVIYEKSPGKHAISKEDIVLQSDENDISKEKMTARSPQSLLVDKLRDLTGKILTSDWEQTFCTLIEQIQTDEKTDPIIKVAFLNSAIETAKTGSWYFDQDTRNLVEILNGGGLDPNANWLLPGEERDKQQSKAAAILKRLPKIADLRRVLELQVAGLAQLSFDQHKWVGWVGFDEGDENQKPAWRRFSPQPLPETGSLFVILQPAADGPIRLETIGRVQNHQAAVSLVGGEALVEGRPVFLVVDAKRKISAGK